MEFNIPDVVIYLLTDFENLSMSKIILLGEGTDFIRPCRQMNSREVCLEAEATIWTRQHQVDERTATSFATVEIQLRPESWLDGLAGHGVNQMSADRADERYRC